MSSMRLPDPIQSVSPLTAALLETLVKGSYQAPVQPAVKKAANERFVVIDPNTTEEQLRGKEEESPSLTKSILNVLNGGDKHSIQRLAFEQDPLRSNNYAGVYQSKITLIPDQVLKRIAIQDDLVASIVNTRAAQIQSFGRPRPDRFSLGFKIVPDEGVVQKMDQEEKDALQERIDRAQSLLVTCGHNRGWKARERLTLSQYLGMSARNAVTVGRIATEIIWVDDATTGQKKFSSFRPIDAGTIYKASPYDDQAESVREEARNLLEQLKNDKFDPEKFRKNEYAWIQVIEGKPVQAFTEDECVVHNFYPVTDIELDGYPVTPIDTAIAAITTHINITTHNRMFFQTGRAAKGMLVIQSDDVSEEVVTRIKHQFQASINNVSNSWRMPVFAIGPDDKMTWQPIDSSARDMEFQYLSDTNARVIMSAFQMSPEELPGYQHLSRGTNNQALSEGNNEYKLEAARDVGIRPLIAQFEDFLNSRILPLIDEKLAEFCVIKFMGLDADTPEKEAIGLQRDQAIHYTYDEVHAKVEKKPIGMEFGGQIPLNPAFQQILDKYFTVGEILERFCGVKGASDPKLHPELAYRRDAFWFQQVQIMQQQDQMAQQQAQAQAQAQGGGAPPQQGQPAQAPAQAQPQPPPEEAQQEPDLGTGIGQVIDLLNKSEEQLKPSHRRLLAQQRATVERFMAGVDADLKKLTDKVVDVADRHMPKE